IQFKKVKDIHLVRKIIEGIISNLSALQEWPSNSENIEILEIFKLNSFADVAPAFFQELARLKFITTPETAQKIWESLLQLAPKEDNLSICFFAAKEYQIWPWLSDTQRKDFLELFIKKGNPELIAKLRNMEDEDVHKIIQSVYIQSVQE